MNKLYLYCEGETEKMLAERLISPYLRPKGIVILPILAGNGHSGKKGGISDFEHFSRDLRRICHGRPDGTITTMIDYSPIMKLPFDCSESGSVLEKVESKEVAIEEYLKIPGLIMNFEVHELEAYFYCNPSAFEKYGKKAPNKVQKIVKDAGGPEYINTSNDGMPSKRLNGIIPNYTRAKKIHTQEILENLSLEQVCSSCEHFKKWIDKLGSIGCSK